MINYIPRNDKNVKEINNNEINNKIIKNNEIKIVNIENEYLEYPLDDEEIPLPEKKVSVKEDSNLTCEIEIIENKEDEQEQYNNQEEKEDEIKANEIKFIIETKKDEVRKDEVRKDEVRKDEVRKEEVRKEEVKEEKNKRKSKTMINSNRFKKKNDNVYYCNKDKEINPKQWDTLQYESDLDLIPLHLRFQPVKITHKKVRDFLVKEKITNENKNLPENLANFLYTSITSNDYQVNFIDIINDT